MFAASPTVIRPPPASREASAGATITIECEAIGVPTPIIVWRLNWGHIGKPPRVSAFRMILFFSSKTLRLILPLFRVLRSGV